MLHEDMRKQARVQVQEGWRRPWWMPWRKQAVWKDVWFGHISGWQRSSNGPSELVVSDRWAFDSQVKWRREEARYVREDS